MAASGNKFDALLRKNVPHILEKIFLPLDYKSFMSCSKVSKTWRKLLSSGSYQQKWKLVNKMLLRDFIKMAMDKPLAKGDTWYLCDVQWFKQLKIFLGLSDAYDPDGWSNLGIPPPVRDPSAPPGIIDLSGLFQHGDPSAELKRLMRTDKDYTIMPEIVWLKLVNTFGLT